MTPERITEVRKILSGMNQSSQLFPITVGDLNSLLAALEEAQQEANKQNEDAKRLNEICNQLAGEEMLFQDGKYETEMQRLENRLAEAQQTIARQHNLFQNINNLSYIDGPAYSAIRVYVDLALGNKEGETQP